MSKIDVSKCLAKDFVEYKYKYHFFEKFDSIDIRTLEKIYSNAGLPDPDAFSEILYDYFAELWNLNNKISKVKKIWNGALMRNQNILNKNKYYLMMLNLIQLLKDLQTKK